MNVVDYHNEGDLDDLLDYKQKILVELQSLFGLYPRTKDVRSVHKFLLSILEDVKVDEIRQFVRYWAGSDQNHSPDHKEIKKYILQIRLRDDDLKDFEPTDGCKVHVCDGSGFVVGIKHGFKYIFKCECNKKSDIESRKDFIVFDKTVGEAY